ncbi:MAG TPA: hypothetical protein VKD47_03845 [Miltoncostaeaceae bacterium]|nr:hypothetical protein [Miltoncostaeaceae bacterium]
MGQEITVTAREGSSPTVRIFECNRSLTGMAIESYPSVEEAGGSRPPDVLARRGDAPPLALEVELPETLVRRETVNRLARLSEVEAMDARVVLIAPDRHMERIREACRLLRRAGLEIPVAALAPESRVITGADW